MLNAGFDYSHNLPESVIFNPDISFEISGNLFHPVNLFTSSLGKDLCPVLSLTFLLDFG